MKKVALTISVLALGLAACEAEGNAVDNAATDEAMAADAAIENAGDAVENAADETVNTVDAAAEEAGNEMEEAANEADAAM